MNPTTPPSFFDFFRRPEQVLTALYTDQLGASVGGSAEARKFQTLFSDAFGHHVAVYLDAEPQLAVQLTDHRRFITSDSLTAYFLDRIYKVPKLYESANSAFTDHDLISYQDFLQSITDTPVTATGTTAEALGSNRLSFLVGDIGFGKTLLLAKAIRDIIQNQRRQLPEPDVLLLPIYFDFEAQMKGPSGQLLDVDETLFLKLCNSLLTATQDFTMFRNRADPVAAAAKANYGSDEAKFVALVRTAYSAGLRVLLILDNIDGYHYYYSKYTFFDEYRQLQLRSLQANVSRLSSILTSGQSLGLLGMSVLIAARRYVYAECLNTVSPETALEYSGSVYQLAGAEDVDVLESRMVLFQHAIQTIEGSSKLRVIGEYYKDTLERISMLFGLSAATTVLRHNENAEARKIIAVIKGLCHHGNRGLVTFFSSLRLDYRKETELIERFFWDKPHTLTLLYIADLRKRYSQKRGHFPNLFLVDGLVQAHPDFKRAHQPHMHTYWLKYLILAYMNSRSEGIATEKELCRVFVTIGGFDETLFRLALGSLATSREFGCIEPEPGEHQVPARLHITSRGRSMVSQWHESRSLFAFSFQYLQLVVDDYLMSYPTSLLDQVYVTNVDLGYLFADGATYGRQNALYLTVKMKCVLALVKVLKESYKQEESLRHSLFAHLRRESPAVLLDFGQIEDLLFDQFRRISAPWHTASQFMATVEQYWMGLENADEPRSELTRYFQAKVPVEG